jgi:hypothetical protein
LPAEVVVVSEGFDGFDAAARSVLSAAFFLLFTRLLPPVLTVGVGVGMAFPASAALALAASLCSRLDSLGNLAAELELL